VCSNSTVAEAGHAAQVLAVCMCWDLCIRQGVVLYKRVTGAVAEAA
jgi:hypothetical protein